MEAKNIRITKVYKSDGGARLFLCIDIPELEVDGVGQRRINNLYRKIADTILFCAESRLAHLASATYKLTHTYELDGCPEGADCISVRRSLVLSVGGRAVCREEAEERLSTRTGLELKKRPKYDKSKINSVKEQQK